MARQSRGEVFSPDEIAIVHVMNRVVRRCFLMGYDALTGKNYDHRKQWIEDQFQRMAAFFAIDLLCFAVMSNHFHQVLRSRPDIAATWTKREVAERWLQVCPKRKRKDGTACEPNNAEIRAIVTNEILVKEYRRRLSDISWWMRLVCQRIAQRCNAEDEMKGKFWESRFKAVRLLDEEAVLACAAYVDLNPIRAAMAEDLVHSDHTSIQRRLQDLLAEPDAQSAPAAEFISVTNDLQASEQGHAGDASADSGVLAASDVAVAVEASPGVVPAVAAAVTTATPKPRLRASGFLAPLEIKEKTDPLGPQPSSSGQRASDKGFLNMSTETYAELLNWTVRRMEAERSGQVLEERPAVLEQLSLSPDVWYQMVTKFGQLFSLVAGRPQRVDSERGRQRGQRFYLPKATRELLSTSA